MKQFIYTIFFSLLISLAIHLFVNIPWISLFSLSYSSLLVIQLLGALGKKIPFKELILSIMGLQLLMSPYLEYYYFKLKIYGGMNVDAFTYYSYALPCTLFLQLGLELFYPKNNIETTLFDVLPKKRKLNERLGFSLIIIGYFFYFISEVREFAGTADFIIYLFSLCRIIGFFYIWCSGSKHTTLTFFLVVVPFILLAINETMFINVIVFFIILMSFYYMKHKTSTVKIYMAFIISAVLLILVQSVKHGYRVIVNKKDFEGIPAAEFTKSVFDQIKNSSTLDYKTLVGTVNVRVNQGWILSDILNNLGNRPEKIEPKYFKRETVGVLLPRFIYPDKPIVGDHTKFWEYTGWRLSKRVAMSVGIMGDGYGNFGVIGGMLYCLGFGMLLGLVFKWWNSLAQIYPTLIIWGVLIFFFSMRAGDETYIIVNWLIKSSVFVFFYFLLFERNNIIEKYIVGKQVLA